MKPKDMAKKRFKLIPGADYTPLKHDTFGEAFGAFVEKRNKQIAGQMPGSFDQNGKLVMNVANEGVERVTDFINPMRGMIKNVSSKIDDPMKFAEDYLRNRNIDSMPYMTKLNTNNTWDLTNAEAFRPRNIPSLPLDKAEATRILDDAPEFISWEKQVTKPGKGKAIEDVDMTKYFDNYEIKGDELLTYAPDGKSGLSIDYYPTSKEFRINSEDFEQGSGLGKEQYMKAWDLAEELGATYKPSGLSEVNQIRTTANMLQYLKQRGKDAKHINISFEQLGGAKLGNSPLTLENGEELGRTFLKKINDLLLPNHNIGADTTDEFITMAGGDLGKRENVHLGSKTLGMLRDLARNGVLGAGAISLGTLMEQPDLQEALKGLNK